MADIINIVRVASINDNVSLLQPGGKVLHSDSTAAAGTINHTERGGFSLA
jgi:hypothetical protein